MYNNQKQTTYPKRLSTILTIGTLVLIVGILHWAREVLMPIALAVLLSFILSPIVNLLQRKGAGPRISVALTVALTFFLIGGAGTLLIGEFKGLANELPAYRQNLRNKIADLHLAIQTGSLGKVHHTVQEVVNELKKDEPPETKTTPPIPVVVKETGGTLDPAFVKSLFAPAVMAGLVIVLVIFMLLRRDDLRDRLLRMAGEGRFVVTSKALEEAGKQVSRYLLRQFLVNTGFGVSVGAGLWAIGIPYALLWGFIAGATRFVPYVGPVLGVVSPLLMSLAVFDGWTALLLVLGLFTCLELLANMLIEPLVYGQGIGVSEVALLVMIAFWTWLWGAAGLVLAAPLTVCLMVVSKSVPSLRFIELLLSRESVLEIHRVFYHRLITHEKNEAANLVETFRKDHSKLELFEQIFIPALIACRRDHQRHKLTDEDRQSIFQVIRQLIEESPESISADIDQREPKAIEETNTEGPLVLGVPANDEADELALLMLADLLADESGQMRVLPAEISTTQVLAEAERIRPVVICIGSLPQGPTLSVGQLCQQLRSRFPTLPVVLGSWSADEQERISHQLANLEIEFGRTLNATRKLIQRHSSNHLTGENRFEKGEGPFLNGQWIGPENTETKFMEQKI